MLDMVNYKFPCSFSITGIGDEIRARYQNAPLTLELTFPSQFLYFKKANNEHTGIICANDGLLGWGVSDTGQ